MKIKFITVLASLIIILAACKSKNSNDPNMDPNIHKVVVKEVIQTSPSYTYLKVKENKKEYWIAISKGEVKDEGTYYYTDGLEMRNFESKDLQRTFETIFFVQEFSDQPILTEASLSDKAPHNMVSKAEKKEVTVTLAEGGITIAELFSNRDSYAGKKVIITAEVIKINKDIMNRNWVHIQDGTSDGDNFDLTVTTKEVYEVGDVVTFEGTIALKKDFGAGYAYDVIMEDAVKLETERQ